MYFGRICAVLLFASLAPPAGAAPAVLTEGPTVQINGSTIVKTYPAPGLESCKADIAALNPPVKRYCRIEFNTKAAPPIDCVVSDWSAWTYSAWTVAGSVETRTGTRTRTVVTPSANGGAACPALSESVTESRPYSPPSAAGTLTVTPLQLPAGGGNASATWSCPSAATLTLNGGVISSASSGSISGQISSTSTVGLSCGGQTIERVIVVGDPPPPPPPPAGTGVATLSWSPSVVYEDDGSLIAAGELAGYRVYEGSTPSTLSPRAIVTETSYSATGLTSGVHYFSVAAVSATGAESAKAPVLSKTVP